MSKQQKSKFAHAALFFCTYLCSCFARLQDETSRNILVTFYGGNNVCVLLFSFSIFFTNAHFHLALVAARIFYFLPATSKFLCCSSNKKRSPLSTFSRLAALACCLISLALFSKFVVMTINLSLILQMTRIQKQYPLYVFVLIDSLVVSALQDLGGSAISYHNIFELHLGCHTC